MGLAKDLLELRGRGLGTMVRTVRAARSFYKLSSPAGRADPYPLYRKGRELGPVLYVPSHTWVVTHYAEAEMVLRDPRFSSVLLNRALSPRRAGIRERQEEFRRRQPVSIVREFMLFKDGEDHTRIRSLVSKAFTRRVIQELGPRVQEIVDDLLDKAVTSGEIDLIGDFAYPLPVTVICELVGIPTEDRARFREWGRLMARFLDPGFNPEDNADILRSGNEAAVAFIEYFSDLIAKRRAEPQDDLLTAMIEAQEGADHLSDRELLATCMLLLVAGHETTMNLIGNGMLALLRNPGELARFRGDPLLAPSVVEEVLRFDSPVQGAVRVALTDVEVGGTLIPIGEDVIVSIGAANRDPAQFPNADQLDIGRTENRHLAFSGGPHFCLGAPLARLEARIALTTLVQRFPALKLATSEPEWRETFTLRGLKSLPLDLGA